MTDPHKIVYVLTHAYSDKSAFNVCGVTETLDVATTWYRANNENDVFVCDLNKPPTHPINALKGWREIERLPNDWEVLEGEQREQ